MADFVMPKLGSDMSAGTLVSWLRKPGETVRRGDIVAEVETDKGVIGIEVFSDGVLEQQLARPGDRVPIGSVLATILEEGTPKASVTAPIPQPTSPPGGRRHRISPSARLLAEKLGVDVEVIHGTGPDGAITRDDVHQAATARPVPAPPTSDRNVRMRQTIAAAMSRSKREVPHYYLSTTIDLHPCLTWLENENRTRPIDQRLLSGVLFIKAVALALHVVPELNSVWEGDCARVMEGVHVGVAVSLRQGGLVAPALHDTDRQDLGTLMTRFQDLVARARAGSLRSSELADPTITVSSLGERGVELMYPIIYPPQVAIVGFGKVVERPWVANGEVIARRVVTATLAADHRVSDGHRGALFLAAVDRLLQEPEKL